MPDSPKIYTHELDTATEFQFGMHTKTRKQGQTTSITNEMELLTELPFIEMLVTRSLREKKGVQ